jgi:hypothetical protein
MMIDEYEIKRNWERSNCDVFEVLARHLPGGVEEVFEMPVRIAGV